MRREQAQGSGGYPDGLVEEKAPGFPGASASCFTRPNAVSVRLAALEKNLYSSPEPQH